MILWDQRYFLTNIFITTNGNLSAYFAIVEKQYGQIPRSRLVINALVETHYFICGNAMFSHLWKNNMGRFQDHHSL